MKIENKPEQYCSDNYVVEVDSIEDAIKNIIPRIRIKSQAFYTENIRKELVKKGNTIIDRHAGGGSYYSIFLNK